MRFITVLTTRSWPWYLGLCAVLAPLWIALRWSLIVPHADHWYVAALPWLSHLEGTPWSSLFHQQMNDSRLDAAQFLHFALASLTGMNTRAESVLCVALAALSGAGLAWLWRKFRPGSAPLALVLTWFATALWLTPDQTMNWMFGVQITYMLAVASSIGVVVSFQTNWPLAWRVLAGGACAIVATYSFAAGLAAWGLGLACLAMEDGGVRFRARGWWAALAVWLVLATITLISYFEGYIAEATNTTDQPILVRLAEDPRSFMLYGLSLVGMPLSRGWAGWEREFTVDYSLSVSPWVGAVTLALFFGVLASWAFHHRRAWGRGQWVFLLVALWGLGIAALITLARTGIDASSPFQNRYLAFTLWFHVGLLALLAGLPGRPWAWLRGVWLVVLAAGYVMGVAGGFDQAKRDEARYRTVAASAALRHAAPEPMWLDYLGPGLGPALVGHLDKLAAHGCLHVPTVKSDLVSEARMAPGDWFVGSIRQHKVEKGRPSITAWAVDKRRRDAVDAVVVSYQEEGQPERWLGMGQKRTVVPNMAAKYRTSAVEDRIGWSYVHGEGENQAFLANGRNPFQAKPLPQGRVTFRVYAFDTATGMFAPLKGSCVMELP